MPVSKRSSKRRAQIKKRILKSRAAVKNAKEKVNVGVR